MSKLSGSVGIFASHGRLALTVLKGKEFKSVCVDIPNDIVASRGGIVSRNLFAAFIKDNMKKNGIKAKNAAFVIDSDQIFIRHVRMPKMNDEQIRYNIPFEFRDSIRGELKDYMYDYAFRPAIEGEKAEGDDSIELLAVAIPVEYYEEITEVVNKAGLKLIKAVPEIAVIERLLREFPTEEERNAERCFLDIGNHASRIQVFKNGRYKLAQLIDIGMYQVAQALADNMNIEFELARTYLKTQYEGCDRSEVAMNAYKDISVEILKGFNYYEMSDMSSRLNEVVLYGTGAMVDSLVDLLKERISMHVITMNEAFPQYAKDGMFNVLAASTGVLLED